jgi:hypothetical protein
MTRTYNVLALVFAIAFALGVNGFIPSGIGWQMPLWLAVVLTGGGLAGCMALPYLRRFLAGASS